MLKVMTEMMAFCRGLIGKPPLAKPMAGNQQGQAQNATHVQAKDILHAIKNPLPLLEGLGQYAKGIFEQDDIGNIAGRLGATLHGDA